MRGDILGGEGDKPVLVGSLPPIFPLYIVVKKAVFFFDEANLLEDRNVADDGAPVDPPFVGDRLVAGKALVGFAVAEGEEGGIGGKNRARENRRILVGDLFKPDPVIFCFAGFGFGGSAVAAGCAHGIFPSISPAGMLDFRS
jgi:hypothetical protein